MKALSVRQPWAWLIVNGIKTVENRTWQTNFRGKFLIHASNKFDLTPEEFDDLKQTLEQACGVRIPADLPTGGIVGAVMLTDCTRSIKNEWDSAWHEPGCFGFILRDAHTLPFKKAKGQLGFFDITHTHTQETEQTHL